MLFSFFIALASFQGYINKILGEKANIFVIVYVANILIYTKDRGQPYMKDLYYVLDQLQKSGFLPI